MRGNGLSTRRSTHFQPSQNKKTLTSDKSGIVAFSTGTGFWSKNPKGIGFGLKKDEIKSLTGGLFFLGA